MKILVAMSGGVDSSVVAHLLHEQGHDIIGMMMKLWSDPLAPTVRRALPKKCCSVEHIQRARSVCQQLDVPFYVVNLENEFKEQVVDPYLESHRQAQTPNPCIECNRTIKFGALLEKAAELGCEKLATGHYARVETRMTDDNNSYSALLKAKDASRDQSYYLYSFNQEKLQHVLFPIGEMMKSDVFALASQYGISIPEYYEESEDLCFYPERKPDAFLRRHIPGIEAGEIQDMKGKPLGTHKGLPFYTIGQRKGLNIGGLKIPLHVVEKKAESNTLVVAPAGEDTQTSLRAHHLNWIREAPSEDDDLHARIHSLGQQYSGTLQLDEDALTWQFDEPIRGIAPGQSIVIYRDEEVLGGGVIA